MDTAKLELFVKIVETENLTKAAQELGYTQGGASHAIRSLENDLGGVKLFKRGREGSLITPAGKAAFAAAKEILYWERQMKKDIFREIDKVSVLRVGFLPSLSKSWMLPIIDQMSIRYPGVRIETTVSDNRTILQLLSAGEIDCGFATPLKNSQLLSKAAWFDPYIAVFSKNHPLANCESVSLQELSKYDFTRTFWDLYDDIIRDVKSMGVNLRIKHAASQYSEIFDSVSDGRSVSIIPVTMSYFGPESLYRDTVFRPIKEAAGRNVNILVHNSKSVSRMVEPFCEVTKELFDCGAIKIPGII